MPEESNGAGAPQPQQSPEGQQPVAGSDQPATPTPDATTPDNAGQPSANQMIKSFAKERGISVEELLDSYRTLEDAGKTELERLTGQVNDFKSKYEQTATELREARSESAFLKAAGEAGALDAETLFMAYKSRLDYDKAGSPTNVSEVLTDLRAQKPHLFKPATGTSDAGRRGDGSGGHMTINDVFREMAGKQ